MSDLWLFVEPALGAARMNGLVTSPVPLRSRRVDDLLGLETGRVDLAGICDEIAVFADEQPDTIDRLTPSMIRLSIAATNAALRAQDWTNAERLARRGRRWGPGNLSLRVQLGQALHGLGRHEEATSHWAGAIDAARFVELISPMLWLLTARALMEQNDDRAAAQLLDELCERHDSSDLRQLRDTVARRAHQGGRR